MYEVIERDHNSIFNYIVGAQADRRDPTSTVSLRTLSFHQIRFLKGVVHVCFKYPNRIHWTIVDLPKMIGLKNVW